MKELLPLLLLGLVGVVVVFHDQLVIQVPQTVPQSAPIRAVVSVSNTAPGGGLVSPTNAVNKGDIPADQWAVMQSAAADSTCGVRAADLAAIAKIESGFGANMSTNSLGFYGYGQFNDSSWAAFGAGGNPYDFHAAIPAIARALCGKGYGLNREQGLNNYGGCTSNPCLHVGSFVGTYAGYVDQVMSGLVDTVGGGAAQVVQIADQWLGVPYLLGGCTTHGIDCSCLVQNAYAALGKSLPRTAAEQYNATARTNAPQAGDLVFFSNTYMPGVSHVGIVVDPAAGTMINAPTDGQTVQVMSYASGYWQAHLTGFGKVS